ncbi:MAG: nicotinate-nucleotide adenylyltransferase [Clostridiales bacterium]|nr:nicotinate-nucleotide adenylyltransferase [Clostridiales bacterium]
MKQKIAVMGGTFDPIHMGHLMVAEIIRADAGMDRVLFIPAGEPPHKQGYQVLSGEERYRMTELAIQNNPYFEASRMEIDRPGRTYTYETLQMLEDQNDGSKEYYYILGADAFAYVPHWREVQKVIRRARFLVVRRPGHEIVVPSEIEGIRYQVVEAALMDISSTQIRGRIHEGKSIRYMVPENVRQYIEENGFYR